MASRNVRLSVLPTATDTERGEYLLKAHSEIINNGAIKVEEAIRDLLETDAWRSYTYPDGTHHEWFEREFDYFVSSWSDTPWDAVRRNIVSRDVITAMADHSGGGVKTGERRSLDEVRRHFPGVTIEAIKLISDDDRTNAGDPKRRQEFLDATRSPSSLARPAARKWQVNYTEGTDPAEAIVAKLNQDPDLALDVYRKLHAVAQKQRRNHR